VSERYWITGVQLGVLASNAPQARRRYIVEGIIEKQFLGNYCTAEEQKQFKKKMEEIQNAIHEEKY